MFVFSESKHGCLRPSQQVWSLAVLIGNVFQNSLICYSEAPNSHPLCIRPFYEEKKTFTQVYINPSFRRVKTWALSAHLWRWVWPLPARRDWWPRTCSYQTVLPSFSCRWLSSQPHVSVRRANNINYQSISKHF